MTDKIHVSSAAVGNGFSFFQILKLDSTETYYKSSPKLTIWTMVKAAGGLFNVLYFIGFIIAYHYQKTSVIRDLISRLYQIEDPLKNNMSATIQKMLNKPKDSYNDELDQ
jgi:hypothetical protein